MVIGFCHGVDTRTSALRQTLYKVTDAARVPTLAQPAKDQWLGKVEISDVVLDQPEAIWDNPTVTHSAHPSLRLVTAIGVPPDGVGKVEIPSIGMADRIAAGQFIAHVGRPFFFMRGSLPACHQLTPVSAWARPKPRLFIRPLRYVIKPGKNILMICAMNWVGDK